MPRFSGLTISTPGSASPSRRAVGGVNGDSRMPWKYAWSAASTAGPLPLEMTASRLPIGQLRDAR